MFAILNPFITVHNMRNTDRCVGTFIHGALQFREFMPPFLIRGYGERGVMKGINLNTGSVIATADQMINTDNNSQKNTLEPPG